ncbi:hypothetical protein PENSPDRAFT_751040 [Peniophora sp. CONT]|nr:hypothetical protein PENSPDRAFT_751040 [Peniophora sp. CONT]
MDAFTTTIDLVASSDDIAAPTTIPSPSETKITVFDAPVDTERGNGLSGDASAIALIIRSSSLRPDKSGHEPLAPATPRAWLGLFFDITLALFSLGVYLAEKSCAPHSILLPFLCLAISISLSPSHSYSRPNVLNGSICARPSLAIIIASFIFLVHTPLHRPLTTLLTPPLSLIILVAFDVSSRLARQRTSPCII